jgi:hypothetical protein
MVIDPTQPFAILELERIKFFLGNLDLTKNQKAGLEIQEAYNAIENTISFLTSNGK